MESCDFLRAYQLHPIVRVGGGEEREGGVVDVTGSCDSSKVQEDESESSSCKPEASCGSQPGKEEEKSAALSESSDGQALPTVRESVPEGGERREVATSAKQSGSVGVCELQRRRRLLERVGRGGGAGYFTAHWRSQLCKCQECLVSHLLPPLLTALSPLLCRFPASPSTRGWAASSCWMPGTPSPPTRRGVPPSPLCTSQLCLPSPAPSTVCSRWRSSIVST